MSRSFLRARPMLQPILQAGHEVFAENRWVGSSLLSPGSPEAPAMEMLPIASAILPPQPCSAGEEGSGLLVSRAKHALVKADGEHARLGQKLNSGFQVPSSAARWVLYHHGYASPNSNIAELQSARP